MVAPDRISIAVNQAKSGKSPQRRTTAGEIRDGGH
jgi:hypothetical protein